MIKKVFEIEWSDILGENWITEENLSFCLWGRECNELDDGFKVKDISKEMSRPVFLTEQALLDKLTFLEESLIANWGSLSHLLEEARYCVKVAEEMKSTLAWERANNLVKAVDAKARRINKKDMGNC